MELFYTIADAASAAARKAVMDLGLLAEVRFRNLYYPEVRDALAERGGGDVPALWDGTRLHEGIDAIRAVLSSVAAARARS